MAITKVVNTSIKARNFLTKFGREKNGLYKQMEKGRRENRRPFWDIESLFYG